MIKKEGIGSYFHFETLKTDTGNEFALPFDYALFYTGRHALLYILNQIKAQKKITKIWFPEYYCQHTLHWIKKTYPDISLYKLNPFDFSSDNVKISEFAEKNDVVIINNYWGLSTMLTEKKTDSPLIIEDHSHGWLSKACLNSKADYCFVSLRKSLPIPLGGIYWKPNNAIIDNTSEFKEDDTFYKIWERMLRAMTMKSDYIENKTESGSEIYVPLFYEVEEQLNTNTSFVKLKEEHRKYIESFLKFNTLQVKELNLKTLYDTLEDSPHFIVVKRQGYTAFGCDLVFKDEAVCKALKSYLVSHNIYPSMLWPDNKVDYTWQYFMNIHADFRYDVKDMLYISKMINSWNHQYNRE
ncbi:hypothetical protein [Yeosuana marina]|uniref:hypothetical protein n=1 Tax=Yeosuana marina TaxID=1565536 RepID=UPI0030ED5101|tara:strand:+ start:3798 stop:4859 length:1062 start_codon:yes stop_codon:yes gene_type:complete